MITFITPIDRPRFQGLRLESEGIRGLDRTVVLVFGRYAEDGTRIGEERLEINDSTTPSFTEFVNGVASARTFRNDIETWYVGVKDYSATVS